MSPPRRAAPLNRDVLQKQVFAWLYGTFDMIYANPSNAIIVPFGTTRVVIDSEAQTDGRFTVHIRCSILQDVSVGRAIVDHVAHEANSFRLGNLYLYREGDGYDLDYSNKVLHTWLDKETIIELVLVAGNNATAEAERLLPRFGGHLPNPGGQHHQRNFTGPESLGRQDVFDALNASLDTQRCDILGTAERLSTLQGGVLVDGWFVVAEGWVWVAGRREHDRETVVWRLPRTDMLYTKSVPLFGWPTVAIFFGSREKLCIGVSTAEAAEAIEAALQR